MSEIFRDPTEGALARRQDLLRKRRDELVMMPHMIRRVVVARAARAAASTAAIVCGFAMLAAALSPKLAAFVASGLPGINPAVISTGVGAAWVLGLVAFAISRGRSEHRFAVAMSTYVLPGRDLDHDIERLSHERPDAVAREMAHRLEIASSALPIAAAALVVPATLIYVAHAIRVHGWPSTAEYEMNLALAAKPMLYCALAGIVAAIAMTRTSMRRDTIIPAAAIGSLLTGAIAVASLVNGDIEMTWMFTAVSVLAGASAFINWRLKRERAALEILDPAAGSELFTIRGLIASLRGVVVAVRHHVSRRVLIGAGAFGLLVIFAGGRMTMGPTAAVSAAKPHSVTVAMQQGAPMPGQTSLLKWTATTDGRIRYDIRFVDGKPITLSDLHGFQVLPKGWRASVTVSVVDSLIPGDLAVSPFPGNSNVLPLHLGAASSEHRFTYSACDGDSDLGLVLTPEGANWPPGVYEVSLLVEPTLELATCDVAGQ